MDYQTITILGSTGSIGVSTLNVLALHPERYRVFALTGNTRIDQLFSQCVQVAPQFAVVASDELAVALRQMLNDAHVKTTVLVGRDALVEVATDPCVDCVMAAIVGTAGLAPTIAAARAGKRILLANKESLVSAGSVFFEAVKDGNAVVLPVDSEHNAIFQSLPAEFARNPYEHGVDKLVLTASGGPFWNQRGIDLGTISPEMACAHPRWSMGRKISVDSATMMNKGLEVIEAFWLFNVPVNDIEVVIHPQSIIHSMVQYRDGSVVAQLGNADMRVPIAYALAYPKRVTSGVSPLDLVSISKLEFFPPDFIRFPCLQLAYDAIRVSGSAPTLLNAANEIAVQAFLDERISFSGIARVVDEVLQRCASGPLTSLDDVFEADRLGRCVAEQFVSSQC